MFKSTKPLLALLCAALALPAMAADVELKTDDDKTLYVIGLVMSRNLTPLKLSPEQLTMISAGIADGAQEKDPRVDIQVYGPMIDGFVKGRMANIAGAEKQASADFIAKKAATPGAVTTDSGLIFIETAAGTGASPAATDRVEVHYHGTLRDGTVFDSSVERGATAHFALNQVIPCWTEGVQRMKVGGKATLVCPSSIAYGDAGSPPVIPPGAVLAFDVELVGIDAPTPQPQQP